MKGSKKTLRIFWTLFAFNALFYVPGATFGLSLIHISEPTRLGMISYAVFCLKKKKKISTKV